MKCTKPFKMQIKGKELLIPCGKCVNCRKGKSFDWSQRIKNHMAFNSDCSFLTLTYENPLSNSDEILSLSKRDLQLFFKRLRKFFVNKKISYFACGEYGDKTSRPHYHILLFGIPMKDLDIRKAYNHLYSDIIKNKIWVYGNNEVGQVETKSIYYVTGYILKNKFNHSQMHYREKEFNLMSKNLGIDMLAERWDDYFEKYLKRESIPSYYHRLIKKITGIYTSSILLNGYNKDAIKIMRKAGKINKSNYLSALKEIILSNEQKEKDYETLEKLKSRRPL